jgi:hypothetical protein
LGSVDSPARGLLKYPNIREKYEAWERNGRLMGFDLSSELQREIEQVEAAKNDPWGHQPPRIARMQSGEPWPRDGPSPIRGAESTGQEAPFGGNFPLDEDLGCNVRHKRKTTAFTNVAHAGKESMHIELPQTTVTPQNVTKREPVEQS